MYCRWFSISSQISHHCALSRCYISEFIIIQNSFEVWEHLSSTTFVKTYSSLVLSRRPVFKVRTSHTHFYFFLLLLKIQMSTILKNFVTVLCPSPAPPVFPGCLTPMPRALGSGLYPSLSFPIWMLQAYPHNQFSSVWFSCSVMSISLRPHGLQHVRPPCPSPTPRVYSDSCLLSQWCHPTISSSVIPFSSYLQSFPASGMGGIQYSKVLEFQLQHQSFQWIFRTDFL